ncbi:MAG: NfeD family protein [Actinomycetota bacterium]|jgi:membrane protein implicated in regulation of membrane protease activity|nr:NfeD family protein [Actinomycetota bacterium]
MDWLSEHAWVAWATIAVLLGVAELVSLDFVLVMLAAGAGAGAVSSLVSPSVWIDLVVAATVAIGMLAVVRPSLVRRMHQGPELTTGHAALVGRKAVVLERVDDHGGRVKLAGEVWTARVFEPGTRVEEGAHVEVFGIEGATAVVYPLD